MKNLSLSLRAKYTIFISAFFAAAIVILTIISVRDSAGISIQTFINDGTPLVRHGAEYLNGKIESFMQVAKDKDPDAEEYEELRSALLAMKEPSSAKYFYTMIPANSQEYMYVIDGSCDPSDEDEFSPLGTLETKDNYGEPAVLAMQTGEMQASEMELQEGWGWLITVFAPIMNGRQAVGFIAADYDATALRASIKSMIVKSVVIAVVLLLLVVLVVNLFLRKLFGRMDEVTKSIGDIASGKADLSEKIPVKADDEIGRLVQSCNSLTESLSKMISSIKNAVVQLSETGKELNAETDTTIQAVQKAKENVGDIDSRAKTQSSTMDAFAESGQEVSNVIVRLTDKIGTQTDAITEISSSVEEITANIHSIDSNVSQISQEYGHLVESSKAGQTNQKNVVEKVAEIQEQAGRLREANSVIGNIARQTNLLAMNAAIEAAHAGVAGQGFAVVAGEIRNLAESSAQQTKSIGDLIKSITESITGIVSVSKLSLDSFESLDAKITEIQKMLSQVQASIDEQQNGANALLQSMTIIRTSSQSIQEASDDMEKASRSVFSQIDALKNAAGEITILSASAQNSMNAIFEQAEKSSEAAAKNREVSGNVFHLVESFKI